MPKVKPISINLTKTGLNQYRLLIPVKFTKYFRWGPSRKLVVKGIETDSLILLKKDNPDRDDIRLTVVQDGNVSTLNLPRKVLRFIGWKVGDRIAITDLGDSIRLRLMRPATSKKSTG